MIGMNLERNMIETVVNATVAKVRGAYQIEHFIIVTSEDDNNLIIKMTDTRTGLRINEHLQLANHQDEPSVKIRSSLVGMAHKLEELYEKRMSEK